MEQVIKSIDMTGYLAVLGGLIEKCNQSDTQISHMIGILSSKEMLPEAATLHMIEYLPDITENGIPILNEADSANVIALSPYSYNSLRELSDVLQNPRFDPTTQLTMHMAEMNARLRLLKKVQAETVRVLFMNRFRIMKEYEKESSDNEDKACIHAMKLGLATKNIGVMVLQSAVSFYKDMNFIAGS